MDFTATDSEGKTIHLADFKGKKNVVLVFNRGFF
jgi:peroxiredoxin